MKDIKQHIITILNKAFVALEKIQSKIAITVITSLVLSLSISAIKYSNDESFYVILISIIPIVILSVYWAFISGLMSVKENVDEISEYISDLKEFKDSTIVNKEKPSLLQVLKALNGLTGLKEAPSMVLDGLSAMKKIAAVFNPLSLFLILGSMGCLWIYSLSLIFIIVF